MNVDRAKGHKRTVERRGPNGAYYILFCECGFVADGFITEKRRVISLHRGHVMRELAKRESTHANT